MENRNIAAAMEDAKEESRAIALQLSEMERLQQRKAQLDSFIAQCQLLLGDTGKEPEGEALFDFPRTATATVSAGNGTADTANWMKARTILIERNNRPIRLSELVREFQARGFKLSEKNPKEVMRTTIRSKPNVFVLDPQEYTYFLKDFPVADPSPAE